MNATPVTGHKRAADRYLSFGSNKSHPEHAVFHAYAAGDLDPAERAVIEAHLAECEICPVVLEEVSKSVDLLKGMQSADLDDLSWQRIGRAVRSELEQNARRSYQSPSPIWSQRWVTAVAVAAAVVALFVWGAPPIRKSPSATKAGPMLVSAEEGFSVALQNGVQLTLEAETRLQLKGGDSEVPGVFVESGSILVSVPDGVALERGFEIRTPAFRAFCPTSGRARVGYWSHEYFVEAAQGAVQFEPEATGRRVTIPAGERRTVHLVAGAVSERTRPEALEVRPMPRPRPVLEPVEPVEKPVERPKSTIASAPEKPAPAPVAPPSTPETSVQVVADDGDALRLRWLEANRVYYETRDLDRTIRLAESVVAEGGARPEVTLALGLLCEAQLARGDASAAVSACERQLARTQGDAAHQIHYKLGNIHKSVLGDCSTAIRHYDQAIVFGRKTLIDYSARMGRAHCALDLGEIDRAERDIDVLSKRPEVTPTGLQALKKRLLDARAADTKKTGEADE